MAALIEHGERDVCQDVVIGGWQQPELTTASRDLPGHGHLPMRCRQRYGGGMSGQAAVTGAGAGAASAAADQAGGRNRIPSRVAIPRAAARSRPIAAYSWNATRSGL